jgi:hypothetical protein
MIIHIQKVETHPEGVENRLKEAIEILEGDIPQPSSECPFCRWYDDYSKVLNGSYQKGRNNNQIDETLSKMSDSIYSTKLNAGSKTYFFDVRETQSGDKYLQITESRLKQDGERYRSNIVIFKEHFNEFRQVLEEIAKKL